MEAIRLFMWGYQGHFQSAVKSKLKSLLLTLGVEAEAEVYLVGKLLSPTEGSYAVCIEPETSVWNEVTFKDLAKIEVQMLEQHEGRQIIQSHPIAQKHQDDRIKKQSFLRAIQEIVTGIPDSQNKSTYSTSPIKVGDYLVTTVLQIPDKDLLPPNSLKVDSYEINEYRRFRLSKSLIDAAVYSLLDEITIALRKDEPGAFPSGDFEKSNGEIIRKAGDNFLQEIELKAVGIQGRGDLFPLLNKISSLKYEGAEIEGSIIIAKKGHPNLELTIELSPAIELSDARRIRKLAQITDNELHLIISSEGAIGFGKIIGEYDCNGEDLFVVGFRKNNTWDLMHNKSILMRTVLGQPQMPKRLIDEKKLRLDLPRIFIGIEKEQVDKLFEVIKSAASQKHGTLLIISDKADDESKRLTEEAVTLTPIVLENKVVQQISEIDGALIVDRLSICYSFGTILDGVSKTGKGDPSRGSRYNSAIRYVESQKEDGKYTCVAVIVSSDGMVDHYPNLRPQIQRSTIEKAFLN